MKFTGMYLFDVFLTMISEIVFLISFPLLVCFDICGLPMPSATEFLCYF